MDELKKINDDEDAMRDFKFKVENNIKEEPSTEPKTEKVELDPDYQLDLNVRWRDRKPKRELPDDHEEWVENAPKKRKLEPKTPSPTQKSDEDKDAQKRKRETSTEDSGSSASSSSDEEVPHFTLDDSDDFSDPTVCIKFFKMIRRHDFKITHECQRVLKRLNTKHEARLTKMALANKVCLLYTSPSPRDRTRSRMPSSA